MRRRQRVIKGSRLTRPLADSQPSTKHICFAVLRFRLFIRLTASLNCRLLPEPAAALMMKQFAETAAAAVAGTRRNTGVVLHLDDYTQIKSSANVEGRAGALLQEEASCLSCDTTAH